MQRLWSGFLVVAALICLVALGALPASAYYPPLQATATWNTVSVTCTVYDPKLQANQANVHNFLGATVVDLKQYNGVIAWILQSGNTYSVTYCTYDPGRPWDPGPPRGFIEQTDGPFISVSNLTVKDGVVAYVVKPPGEIGPGGQNVIYATYDPQRSPHWRTNSYSPFDLANVNLLLQDGLVVILGNWSADPAQTYITYDIYDPYVGEWADKTYQQSSYICTILGSSVTISNASIYFKEAITDPFGTTTLVDWVIGYRPFYEMPYMNPWSHAEPTKPLAYFVAEPSSGPTPLWVWFTDMSIGAKSLVWSFGDAGATSTKRSDYHVYTQDGFYFSQQIVKGAGTDSEGAGIYAGNPDPLPIPWWNKAYDSMASASDLEILRQYRDRLIRTDPRGKAYIEQLYQNSGPALTVLLGNLELMAQARDLINTNMGAVIQALQGHEGYIYDPQAVLAFLQAYGDKAPPKLKALINVVQKEMRQSQKERKPFLGFRLH